MFWSRWNAADKTLLFASALFAFALCVRQAFPGNLLAEGFLFCAEAALVGGAADWFAVTALFEKPLGFPWHTAILPRRRAEFVEAVAALVQREFFSRRTLFSLLTQLDWKPALMRWLESEPVQGAFHRLLRQSVGDAVRGIDVKDKAEKTAAVLRHTILSVPLDAVLDRLARQLRENGRDRALLASAAAGLRARAERPETRAQLVTVLEELQAERLKDAGGLMRFFAGLASAIHVVNFEELAEHVQNEAILLLDEAAESDSALQRRLLEVFYGRMAALGKDEAAQAAFAAVRGALLRSLPLETAIEDGLTKLTGAVRFDLPAADQSGVGDTVATFLWREQTRWTQLARTDPAVVEALEDCAADILRRSALWARDISGAIVREVLRSMEDERLNAIVYEKIEPDLLWIRMNGSIIGAAVGFLLFLLMTAAGIHI